MGGMVTIAVRLSNGEKYAFKKHTSEMYFSFDDIKMLDENHMKKFLDSNAELKKSRDINSHKDYDSSLALFAPYDYGAVIFDYLTKTVFSINNYSPFLNSGSVPIKDEYENYLKNNKTAKVIFKKYGSNHKETIDGFENKIEYFKYSYNVAQGLNLGADILLNDEKINSLSDGYEDIMRKIIEKSPIYKNKDEEGEYIFNDQAYSDIKIEMPGWTIYRGDKSSECLVYVLNEIKKNGVILSEDEENIWKDEIAKELENEQKYV